MSRRCFSLQEALRPIRWPMQGAMLPQIHGWELVRGECGAHRYAPAGGTVSCDHRPYCVVPRQVHVSMGQGVCGDMLSLACIDGCIYACISLPSDSHIREVKERGEGGAADPCPLQPWRCPFLPPLAAALSARRAAQRPRTRPGKRRPPGRCRCCVTQGGTSTKYDGSTLDVGWVGTW